MTFIEIADDLTGAADSGSYFTARGQQVRICISGDRGLDGLDGLDGKDGGLVAVNLSSRNVEKETAQRLHRD